MLGLKLNHVSKRAPKSHFGNMGCFILEAVEWLNHEMRIWRFFMIMFWYISAGNQHYDDVIMTTMAAQITSLTVVYSTVYSDANQRKHQSYASLAFVWGIHRDRWIPRTKGQLRGKCFYLMTSSWNLIIIVLPGTRIGQRPYSRLERLLEVKWLTENLICTGDNDVSSSNPLLDLLRVTSLCFG